MLLAGCGRIGFDPLDGASVDSNILVGDDAPVGPVVPACSSWSAPTLLFEVSSPSGEDFEPTLHPTGDIIVFNSNRLSRGQLWMARRQGGTWMAPVELSDLNVLGENAGPSFSADGARLYFSSARSPVTRLFTSDFDGTTFATPVIVPGLENETLLQPYVTRDELELFAQTVSNRVTRSTRASTSDPWSPSATLVDIDDGNQNGWPSLTPDELTLYWEKAAGTTTGRDIYRATRAARDQPFGALMEVTELNSADGDGDPEVSRDGRTLIMSSARVNATYDIYLASCLD